MVRAGSVAVCCENELVPSFHRPLRLPCTRSLLVRMVAPRSASGLMDQALRSFKRLGLDVDQPSKNHRKWRIWVVARRVTLRRITWDGG